jgi:alkylhydroperoxidase family enzyme
MARLPNVEIPDDPKHPLAEVVARLRQHRSGRIGNLDLMLLHSPTLTDGWRGISRAVRYESTVPGDIRELAICLVGLINKAEYEYYHHAPLALKEGVSQTQLDNLSNWRAAECFDARERAVLTFTEASTVSVRVSEDVFGALREYFDDRQVVELTATVAFYNMVCRFLVALGVEV